VPTAWRAGCETTTASLASSNGPPQGPAAFTQESDQQKRQRPYPRELHVLPVLRRRVRGVAQEERPHPWEQERHDHGSPVPLAHGGRESISAGGRGGAGAALAALSCLPMASSFSLDEQGKLIPTYPCPRPGCGREVPVRFRGFRVEHLKHVGWQAYRVEN
jgi:hypothetical protein